MRRCTCILQARLGKRQKDGGGITRMTTFKHRQYGSTALPTANQHAAASRALLALIDADLTESGATLLTPDGSVIYLDAAQLRQGGRA